MTVEEIVATIRMCAATEVRIHNLNQQLGMEDCICCHEHTAIALTSLADVIEGKETPNVCLGLHPPTVPELPASRN